MSRKTSLVVGCLAVLCVLGLLATPAQATYIIGFQFAAGGTTVTVPSTGGSYVVNVIASVDNLAVTNLGVTISYWGALSSVLNGNLGNATLDGDITAQSMPAAFSSVGGTNGDISNTTADGRDDLGPAANTTVSQRGPSGSHPWWVVPGGGPSPQSFGTPTIVLGSFTVTIPSYTPNANSGSFLSYKPNLQVSSLPAYDAWSENGTNHTGKFNTATGLTFVNAGTSVTFQALSGAGFQWAGGGANGDWSSSANWNGVPGNGSNLVFAGTTQTNTNNNLLSSVGSITFDNTAGAFSLSGNDLTISGGITNNSANTQTINLNLTLGPFQQFSATSANLVFNGTIANGGNTLTVSGSSDTTLAGNISGSGGLIKNGSGGLTLSGAQYAILRSD